MATTEEHNRLLDQLQLEVNRVLEHTGRLFAAVSAGGKGAAVAQAARLKQIIPISTSRFHDALDQLEDELQLANAVMRRDLAVFREHLDPDNPNSNGLETFTQLPQNGHDVSNQVSNTASDVQEVTMTDAPGTVDEPASAEEKAKIQSLEPIDTSMTESLKENANPTENPFTETNEQTKDPNDESSVPNSATADLDSLFNDAGSTAADPESNTPTTKNDPENEETKFPTTTANLNAPATTATGTAPLPKPNDTTKQTDAADFDFAAFSANLNNPNSSTSVDVSNQNDTDTDIAALLPGLQDYANTHPSSNPADANLNTGEVDFEALFGPTGDGEENEGGMPRDTTFHDIFSDFENADFSASGAGDENNFDFNFE
ncbi:Hypothetical protein R9X50_00472800 [Acrodontium crateriforme]|uniref:Uncharacterized protein n=1 Tax=Acrodontium crateriforme TaxID=150365 RepID=A0AAQ3R8L4_9PEZI|nr:Hypothetical protein R9X50_00472800 [Acrodontium crateriforme]